MLIMLQVTGPWFRAVFRWLSKVITWLRLLRLVIGLKDSRQFFNQWEAKPKPIAPCTRDLSRASSELQVIARNCDWFIALPVPVVIGWSNCFGFGFLTVIWKPPYTSEFIRIRMRKIKSRKSKVKPNPKIVSPKCQNRFIRMEENTFFFCLGLHQSFNLLFSF